MITEDDKNTLWLESLSGKNNSASNSENEDLNEALLVRKALSRRRLILEKEMKNTDPLTLIKIEKQLELNGFLKDSLAYKTQQFFKNNFKAFGSGVILTYLISLTLTVETVTYKGFTPPKETTRSVDVQDIPFDVEISERSTDPYKLANELQQKAWKNRMETTSLPQGDGIIVFIKGFTEAENQSDLKIDLGLAPTTSGIVKVTITRKKEHS